MKYIKVFESVNFNKYTGASWVKENKSDNDAVALTVTDDVGRKVYVTIVRKNNFNRTLTACRYACDGNWLIYKNSIRNSP